MADHKNKARKRKGQNDSDGDVENSVDDKKDMKKAPPRSAVKIILGLLLVVFALFGLYVALVPSPIEPRSVQSSQRPYLDGVLAPNNKLQQITKIGLDKLNAPESIAMDREGNIYTGLHDGRIVKITKANEIIDIGHTGERHPDCGKMELESKCGRPLGLHLDRDEKNLIICDAYFGLLKLEIKTNQLTTLLSSSEGAHGTHFKFVNHLAISSTNVVYFTDSSWKWERKDWPLCMLEGSGQGRLISYDLNTGEVEVLLNGLFFANGVALSPDEDFVLVSETAASRIIRLFLKGKNKGVYDLFNDNLPGYPDNIRPSVNGGYWVALPSVRKWPFAFLDLIAPYPSIKNIIAKLYPVEIFQNAVKPYGLILKLDYYGDIIESYHDQDGSAISSISEVFEDPSNKVLYLGSFKNNFLGKLRLDNVD